MITLTDLDRIVPEIIAELEQIHRNMSRYKKLNTDFRGITLMREIEAKIRQIRKVHDAYRATPSYRTKDFTNWVQKERHYVAECQKIYEKIKAYEDVAGYK